MAVKNVAMISRAIFRLAASMAAASSVTMRPAVRLLTASPSLSSWLRARCMVLGIHPGVRRQLPHRGELPAGGIDAGDDLPGELFAQLEPDGAVIG